MLDKKNSKDKIDPAVASVMAFRMACKAPRYSGSLFIG
jgi:phage terminase large subunit-like protein